VTNWQRVALLWFKVATEPEERNGRLVPWRKREDVRFAVAALFHMLKIDARENPELSARIKTRVEQALNLPTPTPKKRRPLRCSKCDKIGHNRSRCREVTALTSPASREGAPAVKGATFRRVPSLGSGEP